MNKQAWFKKVLITVVLSLAGGALYHVLRTPQEQVAQDARISSYTAKRDRASLIKLFSDNWYTMTVREFNPEKHVTMWFDNADPNEWEKHLAGTMRNDVLWDNDQLVGVTSYYKQNFYQAKILFLLVDDTMRGKGYGKALIKHAIAQLKDMGIRKIILSTRVDNERAQRFYTNLGFVEEGRDNGFVNYALRF